MEEPDLFEGKKLLPDFDSKLKSIFNEFYISEALHRITEDVNLLWNKLVKPLVVEYTSNPNEVYSKVKSGNTVPSFTTDSSVLQSVICQEAHQKNPIPILSGHFRQDNLYDVKQRNIQLCLPYNAILALEENGLNDKENVASYYRIEEMFSEELLKEMITHELAHWIDDSVYGGKLTHFNKNNKREITDRALVYPEINAIVNGLAVFKSKFSQTEWDDMSTPKLILLNRGLWTLFQNHVKHLSVYNLFIWEKTFFSRLAREGLLGKSMQPLTSDQIKQFWK